MRELINIPRIGIIIESLKSKFDFEIDFSYLKIQLKMYLEPLKVVKVS